MIRVLNAEPDGYSQHARSVLSKFAVVVDGPLTRRELLQQLKEFEALVVRFGHRIDREVIDAGPRLKAIVTAATGVDHIDVSHAASKGVEVLSLRGESEFLDSVSASAEHTWALLLAMQRRIPHAFDSVRAGGWNRDSFRGHDLDGKRLGIVGLGRVGRKVARYALAFGMQVAAYDPYATNWDGAIRRDGTLADVCRGKDVLSVHVPLTNDTVKLIGREQFQCLAPGAVLVNTSRGQVIDETALLEGLEHGLPAAAAVDVLTDETAERGVSQNLLVAYARSHDNLLITPHIGGATYESMAKTEDFVAAKLARFFGAVSE